MKQLLKVIAILSAGLLYGCVTPTRTVVVERRRPTRTVVVQQPREVIVVEKQNRGRGHGRGKGRWH